MFDFLVELFFFLGDAIQVVALVGGLMAFVGSIWLTCTSTGIRFMVRVLRCKELPELEDEYEA